MTAGYDLVVIGAGSAGFSAAITAAEQGASVALIGDGTIGGTCVNVGCVPSKTMIRAMEAVHQARAASRFAGLAGDVQIDDWSSLVAQKDDLVDELRQAKYVDLLSAYDTITYVPARAQFTAQGLRVDGADVQTDRIVIATGSKVHCPDIAGIADIDYLTSTTALELDALPASMLIVGGGYIGCELAQVFLRAGVDVTLVCRRRLLPEGEPEISDALAEAFRAEGMTVLTGASYQGVASRGGQTVLSIDQGGATQDLVTDKLLLATGRTANVEGLGLNQAGIAVNGNHGIKVDDRMRSSRLGVYAAGDVTGNDQFVYMAAYGGRIAAENALNGDSLIYDNRSMPAVTFTDPQVATVGLTEAAARTQGIDVKTSLLPLNAVPRALAARDTRGLIKLVADAQSDRLIGAHIMAPEGADSIQTAALAIAQGMTTKALGGMIFPYLTTVEGLKLAAQTFDKDITKLSCCAG
jgi:mercuric reductase